MREVRLSKYQPRYYRKSQLIGGINQGIEAELQRVFQAVEGMQAEMRVTTATDWLSVWERSVGLIPHMDLELEQRRSRVLARLRQMDTTTPERIKVIVQSYARGDVEVIEDFEAYVVTIKFTNRIGRPDNMDGIVEQLSRIMPAHLAVTYVYPYRTWGEVLNTGKTWRELSEAGYTWRDVMEKEAL